VKVSQDSGISICDLRFTIYELLLRT